MIDYQAMSHNDEYRRKLISADEAAGLVKPGMWVDYGSLCGFPLLIDEKLARRASELERVKIRAYGAPTEPHVLKADPKQEHFIYNSWRFSSADRKYHDIGCCSYIPSNLNEMPRMYREWLKDETEIAFIEVTPMDKHGYFNFGASITFHKALCDTARTVVVEVNESQPWVRGGYDEVIHVSQVDYIVENSEYKIPEIPVADTGKTSEEIAENAVTLIEDGATLEFGIGAIPNAVGKLLIKHGLKDLGIHSGTLTDSMVDMIEAGVVTGRKKSLNPGKVVHCCALGSRRLYEFIRDNTMIAGFPSDYTHDIQVIARNHKQVAVNGAIKVDLTGQVCSESVGYRQISGTGGQLNFTRGASMSSGGKALICLPSSYRDKNGKLRSNIVPHLEFGDIVTVPRSESSYIVTEFGTVNLKGKSTWQRTKLLTSIAHPELRDGLEEAAGGRNLITRGSAELSPDG
ncbi:acetyl-CoA hydrolase/transferase family protein [Chloroflexota bacterium]